MFVGPLEGRRKCKESAMRVVTQRRKHRGKDPTKDLRFYLYEGHDGSLVVKPGRSAGSLTTLTSFLQHDA